MNRGVPHLEIEALCGSHTAGYVEAADGRLTFYIKCDSTGKTLASASWPHKSLEQQDEVKPFFDKEMLYHHIGLLKDRILEMESSVLFQEAR